MWLCFIVLNESQLFCFSITSYTTGFESTHPSKLHTPTSGSPSRIAFWHCYAVCVTCLYVKRLFARRDITHPLLRIPSLPPSPSVLHNQRVVLNKRSGLFIFLKSSRGVWWEVFEDVVNGTAGASGFSSQYYSFTCWVTLLYIAKKSDFLWWWWVKDSAN